MIKGIDVAKWNGVIDWKKVKKSGVEFVVLKAINKSLAKEAAFERNYAGAKAEGLPVDVYNYSYATTIQKAVGDANRLVEAIEGKEIDRVWLDIEDVCYRTLGNGNIKEIVLAYKRVIEKNGYLFGVYTGLSFYNEHFRGYNFFYDFPFWIARYPKTSVMELGDMPDASKKPSIVNDLWGWQYTSNGRIPGIAGAVDISILYGIEKQDKKNETIATGTGIVEYSLKKDGEKFISNNFKVKEFRCKDGSDTIKIDVDFVKEYLQTIRDYFGVPVTINSAYRTEAYNKKVGGASNSYHMKGQAFDIVVKGKQPEAVAMFAKQIGIRGVIRYNTFTHIDSRENRYHAINNNGKVTVL